MHYIYTNPFLPYCFPPCRAFLPDCLCILFNARAPCSAKFLRQRNRKTRATLLQVFLYQIDREHLGNVGVSVPNGHVVLHWRHEHGRAARLGQVAESLRLEVKQEVRVPVFAASKTPHLDEVANVVPRVTEALVGRLSPVHPQLKS